MLNKPRSILVVDDEPDACANLSDILSDLGFEVSVAYDGDSALDLIHQRPFDVALLDLRMPGMDGLELYQRIKERRAETIAMIVTAYATDATARDALHAGAWRIVPKPVDLRALVTLVEEASKQPIVMVIDDDVDLCDSLWDVFHDQGYRTSIARSLDEAARHLRDTTMHVALIDMRLPGGDGHQVFQLVRESNPHARTVLITGYRGETEQLVAQAIAEGADAVCYKPFDVQALIETVHSLSRHRLHEGK